MVYISLFFDKFVGVGHAAWLIFYSSRKWMCKKYVESGKLDGDHLKPTILRVKSAELLAATGNAFGSPTARSYDAVAGTSVGGTTATTDI